ncbi:hypothetical protein WJX81_001554 [Elliptochloris bilobata]|uniref:L-ornithine N(5)-oxygenase n=1 Tax=Elliptochloris bilobata TaxID=381761 RepID=A0AAW1SI90_9CHLO
MAAKPAAQDAALGAPAEPPPASGTLQLGGGHVSGRRVVVVGGGMSAAALALAALRLGAAHVTIVCRAALVVQEFECEVGWYGNKRLAEYAREACPRARLRAARGARPQATIDVPTAQALQAPWAAAAAALGAERGRTDADLPLEGHGPLPPLPVPKVGLRALGTLDVSDLDAALPRLVVAGYRWTDDGFELCITLPLGEPVPREQVRALFAERAVEVWAVGQAAAYHLHLPRLYGRTLPARARIKVNSARRHVYVLLHKEADAAWRFLRG